MSLFFENSIVSNLEAEISGKEKKFSKVHIHLQQRNTKKYITHLKGLQNTGLDLKLCLKDMRKKFSCGGTISTEPAKTEEDEDELILSLMGDQRKNAAKYLLEKGIESIEHGF